MPSHLRDTGLYPAMAHYAPGKEVQISEHSIQKVQDLYAAAVAAAESVGVIGVRPNVEDGHVWTPLAETPARILYVQQRGVWLGVHIEGLDDAGRLELDLAENAAWKATIERARIVAGEA